MNRDYYIAGEYAVFGGVHAFPVQLVRSIHIIGDIMRVGVQRGCNTEIELHDYYIDVSKETLIKIGEFVEAIKKGKEGYNAHIEYNSSNGMTLFPRITRYELELCSSLLAFVNILLIAFLFYFISVH